MTDSTPDTTWDGLEIAEEFPRGATVVVRRPAGGLGRFEYLLLHRAHNGPDYDGWWAWTPPAGSRQPGEAVAAAAARELYEEAGIAGAEPTPVDVSGRWARFFLDVPADTKVTLIDPEHDRYRWADAGQAGRICRPSQVAQQVAIADTIPAVTWSFRELHTEDAAPLSHDSPFHPDPQHSDRLDLDTLRRRFAQWSDPAHPHRPHLVYADGVPAGYAWHYPTGHPDEAGIAVALTDPAVAGRGLAASLIWGYLRHVVLVEQPRLRQVVAAPQERNAPAIRALAKAGFVAKPGEVPVYRWDVAHWFQEPRQR